MRYYFELLKNIYKTRKIFEFKEQYRDGKRGVKL